MIKGAINNGRGRGTKKTVDAFDFSVSHLSMYERRLNLMHQKGAETKNTASDSHIHVQLYMNVEQQVLTVKASRLFL